MVMVTTLPASISISGGLAAAPGSVLLTFLIHEVSTAGGVPPEYSYCARLARLAHISPMISLTRKLASMRYLESATVLIAMACMPTTARMPIEKIRMPSRASSSATPRWLPEVCRFRFMCFCSRFGFRAGTWILFIQLRTRVAHLHGAAAGDDHPQGA